MRLSALLQHPMVWTMKRNQETATAATPLARSIGIQTIRAQVDDQSTDLLYRTPRQSMVQIKPTKTLLLLVEDSPNNPDKTLFFWLKSPTTSLGISSRQKRLQCCWILFGNHLHFVGMDISWKIRANDLGIRGCTRELDSNHLEREGGYTVGPEQHWPDVLCWYW